MMMLPARQPQYLPFGHPLPYNPEAHCSDYFAPARGRDAFAMSSRDAFYCQSAAPPRPAQHHARPAKAKAVLPCFNLICTGTCAYGPKCTFLHDPRAQLPKHVRKSVEFVLQSHLHTFRPNLQRGAAGEREKERERERARAGGASDDDCSACTDSDCSSHGAPQSHSHSQGGKSLTFRRDDLFDFPMTPLSYQEPNAKYYDPADDQLAGRDRELSMWYHLLAAVSDKNAALAVQEERRTHMSRLPVFQQLSGGRSVSVSPTTVL